MGNFNNPRGWNNDGCVDSKPTAFLYLLHHKTSSFVVIGILAPGTRYCNYVLQIQVNSLRFLIELAFRRLLKSQVKYEDILKQNKRKGIWVFVRMLKLFSLSLDLLRTNNLGWIRDSPRKLLQWLMKISFVKIYYEIFHRLCLICGRLW